jgi:hypothetical protein
MGLGGCRALVLVVLEIGSGKSKFHSGGYDTGLEEATNRIANHLIASTRLKTFNS